MPKSREDRDVVLDFQECLSSCQLEAATGLRGACAGVHGVAGETLQRVSVAAATRGAASHCDRGQTISSTA
eukprot:5691016-Pyramimonas_sp.AAC.1